MIYLKHEEGLTLIEAVIALVVMLVLVTAFAGAMTVGLQSEIEVEKRLQVSDIASSIVEYLGIEGNLPGYIGERSFEDEDINIENILGSSYDELYFEHIDENRSKIKVEKSGIADADNLYEVNINIFWVDRGNLMSYELSTLIYKSDNND